MMAVHDGDSQSWVGDGSIVQSWWRVLHIAILGLITE